LPKALLHVAGSLLAQHPRLLAQLIKLGIAFQAGVGCRG
jgi:hypothetical protein